MSTAQRWAWIEVSPSAIAHNVKSIRQRLAGEGDAPHLWAVVKANGYGHGAATAARAALDGGASGLCVALVQEGCELRSCGFTEPILVLSQQPLDQLGDAIDARLELTVYDAAMIDAVAAAVAAAGQRDYPVHLKVDTGMNRVGCAPDDAVPLARAIDASPVLRLRGVMTHMAIADEPAHPHTAHQLATFDRAVADIRANRDPDGDGFLQHAANSAATLAHRAARYDMVRVGIAVYGLLPSHDVGHLCADLLPALALKSRVGHVKTVNAGEALSYGLRHTVTAPTTIATVPIGYADGVSRRYGLMGGEVLIGGRRRPVVGVVTMDQLLVDCGPADEPGSHQVAVGDEVVLIGSQGTEQITADEWAHRVGTIGYEIVCGLSARLPRHVV